MMRSVDAMFAGALLWLAGMGAVAAQGTPEQQEACAPDAVKLCSDTIPDVARTTACMKRHAAQLSPRCHRAFVAATQPGDRGPDRPARHARPDSVYAPSARDAETRLPPQGGDTAGGAEDGYGPRRYEYLAPDGAPARTGDSDVRGDARGYDGRAFDDQGYGPDDRGYDGPAAGEARDRARADIDRLCAAGELDPRTCDTTERALDER